MTIKIIDVSPEPTKTNRGPKTVFDFASLQVGQGAEFPAGYFKSAVTANNRACAITRKLLPSRFEARAHGDGFIMITPPRNWSAVRPLARRKWLLMPWRNPRGKASPRPRETVLRIPRIDRFALA